jgi:virulence-associated protein VagC
MTTLNVYALPEFLSSRLSTDRISITEEDDGFMLKPIKQETMDFSSLRGMLNGNKQASVEKHLKRMREELKLELELES